MTAVTQTILFGAEHDLGPTLVHGWAAAEAKHVWSIGPSSAIRIDRPAAPEGYFLEILWYPFVVHPWVPSQPITISVNGERIFTGEVRSEEIVAFRCPSPRPSETEILITFDHPNASRPADFGKGDTRSLGLAFRRIRVLPIIKSSVLTTKRQSHRRLTASDLGRLRSEIENSTGTRLDKILTSFEMLAGNCDMGIVQRVFNIEPLSLLRFAGSYAEISIKGLDTDFEGIGQELDPWVSNDGEWMIHDRYGLNYHTMQSSASVSEDQVVHREQTRVPFLKAKLLEDLAGTDKVFVADRSVGEYIHNIMPLYLALNRKGMHQLLWIVSSRGPENGGLVHEILPGLLCGYLFQFRRPFVDHISVPGWLEVIVNAWLLREAIKGHAAQ